MPVLSSALSADTFTPYTQGFRILEERARRVFATGDLISTVLLQREPQDFTTEHE